MEALYHLLQITPGITSVIGSGGKTSLIRCLAEELPGQVLVTTTTHMYPYSPDRFLAVTSADDLPALRARLAHTSPLCIGTPAPDGKISAPGVPFSELLPLADYILVEADGSRQLPLKAHAAWEPVIPDASAQTICVAGASGFGRPIREVCHRPELYCKLTGLSLQDPASAASCADVLLQEHLYTRIFINQADPPISGFLRQELDLFSKRIKKNVYAGSLHTRYWFSLHPEE
jgi:probable selenium-dependent hydroxylase accessory protein YqeC